MLDVATGWIFRGFGDYLANRSLQFVRVGLRFYAIEVQIHGGLFHTIKVLKISEGDELAVAKGVSLIGGELRGGNVWHRSQTSGDREQQPKRTREVSIEKYFQTVHFISFFLRGLRIAQRAV